MQGNATAKANPVSFYWIESHTDITPCMEAVGTLGYSGVATATAVDGGQVIWALTLNGPGQTGLQAVIGNVVVWDGMQITIYPNSDSFLALYVVSP